MRRAAFVAWAALVLALPDLGHAAEEGAPLSLDLTTSPPRKPPRNLARQMRAALRQGATELGLEPELTTSAARTLEGYLLGSFSAELKRLSSAPESRSHGPMPRQPLGSRSLMVLVPSRPDGRGFTGVQIAVGGAENGLVLQGRW